MAALVSRCRRPLLKLPCIHPYSPRYYSSQPSFLPDLSSKFQFYKTLSSDPFVNLSFEHYLLQNTPPDSAVLLLYINRPCVVIGRNQNPWSEINFQRLKSGLSGSLQRRIPDFVRRRSGGGAVFHDEGNLNFSVICPKTIFTRNKHAYMVVRALQAIGVDTARVNDRHDIVVDVPSRPGAEGPTESLKVSGSAYRLTGARALHHGTCLVDSPNLGQIGAYLRSPARSLISAKGVESVRSKVANVASHVRRPVGDEGIMASLEASILKEFRKEYGVETCTPFTTISEDEILSEGSIRKGIGELKSDDWRYNQTPQFTFSTETAHDTPGKEVVVPSGLPTDTSVYLDVKSGAIRSAKLSTRSHPADVKEEQATSFDAAVKGRRICEISDWRDVLATSGALDDEARPGESERVGAWLNSLLGYV